GRGGVRQGQRCDQAGHHRDRAGQGFRDPRGPEHQGPVQAGRGLGGPRDRLAFGNPDAHRQDSGGSRSMRRWIPFWFVAALALGAALPLGCGEPEKCKGADCDGGQAGSGGSEPECQTNLDCEPGLACIEGECSPCGSDGHCLRVERCDPASLRCVYREGWGNECSAHEQCPLGRYCVQGLCIAVNLATPCGSMGQCPEGMRCNTRVGNPPVCEEDVGCGDDLDCRDNEVCNQRTGQCEIACTPENQAEVCRAREICVDGQCVECETDEDCSLGLVCDGGFCVGEGTCFTDRDCPVGQVCNRRIHIC